VSEKDKKEPQSGSKFSRRNLIGGAATGIVASALAGIVPAKKAEASFPPLFCPDSGFTVHNVCGGQNCFSTITIGGGAGQNVGFSGSGTLDKANQNPSTGAFPFRHKVLICFVPNVGRVCVQLRPGGSSVANPGNVSIGGNNRYTVTNSVLDQRFTFLDQLDGNGDPISVEPGALNMNLNAGQSTDTSMKFEPDNSFPAGGISLFGSGASEVKLTGYSMSVDARPKSGDTHLLTITNVSYSNGQLDFRVTKHSSVGAITGNVVCWVHNPDDAGLPILATPTWTGGNLVSNNVSVQLGTAQESGDEVRIEVSTPDDSRKLFNFYVHTW
jgi:hypothetical protein